MSTDLIQRPADDVAGHPGTPVRGQRLSRMIHVELRKMLDTRAGLWVVLATFGVTALAGGWLVIDGAQPNWRMFSSILQIAGMLLPVIALMSMTAEWTQRTALTTFTLSPRRGRVLTAKFTAALLLCAAAFLVMIGIVVLAMTVAGAVNGGQVAFDDFGTTLRALAIIAFAQVLMGMGFGALTGHTAFAIVLFFLAQTVIPLVTFQLLMEDSAWLNVLMTYDRLASDTPGADLPQTLVSLTVWVVLPFTVGIIRSLRREVK